ncbi:MAG: hypothetical protein ACQEWU_12135 [Bacillota bacterium]|uniref:DUF4352 domain-containing protein n=1 Tax=Virgibacillus salarius TaxID=447199 RepID=A0A941ICQ6_9BACI|nr:MULTISPECIES: hypothetical protein [Bacillaceae]MBR7796395.1 hypothetical protein [Virgibacillus salarius]MCC2250990.1 hypothetical protein [Virgibacillus sp. AGTR]NAZ09104.1 hypothetical protein [Agaribacter marinus]WBX80587.1 hypothetical protein PD280_01605 [Virgibacillus salarius]
MKKICLIFLAIIMLVAGCSDSDNTREKNKNPELAETANNNREDIELHNVGETVQVKSNKYDFTYEVTLNSYKEKDEYEGKSVADFNADGGDFTGVKFAVVNLTIKNTSTELFIPFDKIEPIFLNSAPLGFFNELTPELGDSLNSGE